MLGGASQAKDRSSWAVSLLHTLMISNDHSLLAVQITLFAHPHRISTWHSINTMDYELERVQWDLIPGYVPLHRYNRWAVVYVADSNQNLYGREMDPDDLPETAKEEGCLQV